MPISGQANKPLEPKAQSKNTPVLTPKQQLKQDAMLWAEFLYSEFQREKALREGEQQMPTHYDNSES